MTEDVIMQMVHEASEAAVKKHGGIDGYFKHLQQLDRARRSKSKTRAGRKRRVSLIKKS